MFIFADQNKLRGQRLLTPELAVDAFESLVQVLQKLIGMHAKVY